MSNRAGNGRASGVRARCHELLEPARAGDAASRAVDVALIALIVYSVVTMVLDVIRTGKVRKRMCRLAVQVWALVHFLWRAVWLH